MSDEIGAFDAKTRLPELLREVAAGKRFTITHRGRPVAELVPPGTDRREALVEAMAAFDELRALHPLPGPVDVRALREEGRA
jgi:prevent-host-death family protein